MTWSERILLIITASIVAVFVGLMFGGFFSLFLTRLASMRIGGLITLSSFVIIMFGQGAWYGIDEEVTP